jgi:hypothetical protein
MKYYFNDGTGRDGFISDTGGGNFVTALSSVITKITNLASKIPCAPI